MPNNVREMTDKDLIDTFLAWPGNFADLRKQELAERFAQLHAEVESLKAVIEQIKRLDGYIVDDAYRAMKGEGDGVD